MISPWLIVLWRTVLHALKTHSSTILELVCSPFPTYHTTSARTPPLRYTHRTPHTPTTPCTVCSLAVATHTGQAGLWTDCYVVVRLPTVILISAVQLKFMVDCMTGGGWFATHAVRLRTPRDHHAGLPAKGRRPASTTPTLPPATFTWLMIHDLALLSTVFAAGLIAICWTFVFCVANGGAV